MSLASEINRTETEKNKTKTVAMNIDNKLVELGGEQAINLADVPNKIQKMIGQYKQVAIFSDLKTIQINSSQNSIRERIAFNLDFYPTKVLFQFKGSWSVRDSCVVFSDFHNNTNNSARFNRISLHIENLHQYGFDIVINHTLSGSNTMSVERVIAIG